MTDELKKEIRKYAIDLKEVSEAVPQSTASPIGDLILELLAEIERLEAQRAKETSGLRDQIAMMLLDAVLNDKHVLFGMKAIWSEADKILKARSKGSES
jgi:hypothetical protein